MISVVRKVTFSAGHRVYGHESQCAHLHGHNYIVYFHATADSLDKLGRIIDFEVLKTRLGGWIDQHWDHAFIVYAKDEEARRVLEQIPGQRCFVLSANPTAENIAQYLLKTVAPKELADTGVTVFKVVVWETENCCAEAMIE